MQISSRLELCRKPVHNINVRGSSEVLHKTDAEALKFLGEPDWRIATVENYYGVVKRKVKI